MGKFARCHSSFLIRAFQRRFVSWIYRSVHEIGHQLDVFFVCNLLTRFTDFLFTQTLSLILQKVAWKAWNIELPCCLAIALQEKNATRRKHILHDINEIHGITRILRQSKRLFSLYLQKKLFSNCRENSAENNEYIITTFSPLFINSRPILKLRYKNNILPFGFPTLSSKIKTLANTINS